jgi:hypothetical protein
MCGQERKERRQPQNGATDRDSVSNSLLASMHDRKLVASPVSTLSFQAALFPTMHKAGLVGLFQSNLLLKSRPPRLLLTSSMAAATRRSHEQDKDTMRYFVTRAERRKQEQRNKNRRGARLAAAAEEEQTGPHEMTAAKHRGLLILGLFPIIATGTAVALHGDLQEQVKENWSYAKKQAGASSDENS